MTQKRLPTSRDNVEAMRAATEAIISGEGEFDAEGLLTKLPHEELLDPQIEWDASEAPVLDISGVYRGIEGVRRYWRQWLAAWRIHHYEFRVAGAGDRVVGLFDHQLMWGRSTGIEVPVEPYAVVATIRDGRCVHWKLYMSQADALESVGLSKQNVPAHS